MKTPGNLSKEKLQQVILVAIITGAVGVATYLFYVKRQLDSGRASRQQIAELQTKLQDLEAKAKKDRNLNEKRPQIMAFAQQHRDAMVTGDPFSWCVRQVSLLAEKHPVRVLGMRPGTKGNHPRVERYEVFEVQLEVEGHYDQLGQFVCDLENRFATAEIRKVEVQATDATSGARRLALTMGFLIQPEAKVEKATAS